MYNPFSRIKSVQNVRKRYDNTGAETWAVGGLITGSALGFAVGVGIPVYFGWEISEYVADALKLGGGLELATKMLGSIALTAMAGRIIVPFCILAGASVGGLLGAATGMVKDSLEGIISKNRLQ